MKTEVISEQQGVFLVSFFVIGSAIVISIGGQAGRDVWIAIFLGMCIAIPLLAIYARLHVLLPGKDLFDILEFALGKFLGKIVGILYTSFAINLGAIVLRDFGEFLTTVALTETPQLVPVAVLGLLCAWGVKEGIEVLGRWSSIFFRVVLVIFVVTLTLISPEIELKHLQPFFYYGITPVLLGAFSTISFPFAETIMFPMIFCDLSEKEISLQNVPLRFNNRRDYSNPLWSSGDRNHRTRTLRKLVFPWLSSGSAHQYPRFSPTLGNHRGFSFLDRWLCQNQYLSFSR